MLSIPQTEGKLLALNFPPKQFHLLSLHVPKKKTNDIDVAFFRKSMNLYFVKRRHNFRCHTFPRMQTVSGALSQKRRQAIWMLLDPKKKTNSFNFFLKRSQNINPKKIYDCCTFPKRRQIEMF